MAISAPRAEGRHGTILTGAPDALDFYDTLLGDPQPRRHDLRHTAATFWLAAGLKSHAVAELLGHADAGLVDRLYGHALPDELASAGQILEQWRTGRRVVDG